MRVLLSRDIDGAAGDVYYLEMAGISSETKPTANVATGSKFYEVDTDTNYVYDEDSGDWTEAPSVVDDVNDLKNEINGLTVEETLLRSDLPGTTVTVTFDSNNNPVSIVHSASGATVRTDAFVWGTDTVTETRTASDKYITITTNLTTLAQTVSEIQEVA